MEAQFGNILNAAVTPIVLISGVGLILLSLINRYNQAITRTRSLVSEMRASQGGRKECLSDQVDVLVRRCGILRLSIGFLVASVILSSLIVLESVITVLIRFEFDASLILLLFSSCICIVIANILLLTDITLSLKALKIEINYRD